MNRFPNLTLILILLVLCVSHLTVTAVSGQGDEETTLYSTHFSDSMGWTTNSNERFGLDNVSERYHYLIEGGTGAYSTVMLPKTIPGSCTVEFDITPVLTDEGGTHRFGIGTEKKDSLKGPLIMAELANKKDGRLFYLKTISKGNALNIVGSSPSTGSSGLTVRFEDNTTYHIRIAYYAEENRASMTISKAGSTEVLASLISPVSGRMEELTHLFITAIGDGVTGPKAEGYIDNITVMVPDLQPAETATPEPGATRIQTAMPTLVKSVFEETEPERERELLPPEPEPARTPFPLPPTQEPAMTQKSGGTLLLVFPSIAIAGGIFHRKRAKTTGTLKTG